ncbi:hypothetical protein ACFV6B_12690 [Streptomyces microflavus]|uniref:hypothetical protein n=1 Tax=Streptomyces microflavus TaxID=1919 RepID=UPI003665CBB8
MSPFLSKPQACCQVDDCARRTPVRRLAAGWSLDSRGRPFCPEHPVESACRICGRDKGENKVICSACIRA